MNSLFNAAVEKLYDCSVSPEKWPDALLAVTDCINAAGTGLFFQRQDGALSVIMSPGVLESVTEHYIAEGWDAQDLRAVRAIEANAFGTSSTLGDLDLVSASEMDTHPYYTQFLGKHGLRWFIAASISPKPDLFVVLSVQRFASQPNFTADERETLEALSRHAEKALRLSSRLMQAELSNLALADALDRLSCGVVVVNGLGEPIFANAGGQPFLNDLRHSSQQLRGPNPESSLSLFEEVQNAVSGRFDALPAVSRPIFLNTSSDHRCTIAYVIPATEGARSAVAQSFGDVRAIIMFMKHAETNPLDATIVRDAFGVTLGEARVASLVGAGQSPRDVASALGITEETARTVLKRVFAKLNVSKQSQLALLLGELSRATLRDTSISDRS